MDSKASTLVSMGFDPDQAEGALRAQDGDVERALEQLLTANGTARTAASAPIPSQAHVTTSLESAHPNEVVAQEKQVHYVSFRHDRRGACSWILNILWILVGGWHMFLTWFLTGVTLCLTCVLFPCGWQVIKISFFLLFPFGVDLVYTDNDIQDDAMRCCSRSCNFVLNVIWAITVGWILALQAIIVGILLCITIIGIPFGLSAFKLGWLSFCPFGLGFSTEELEIIKVTEENATSYTAMRGSQACTVPAVVV